MRTTDMATREFHVSRRARDLYRFADELFSTTGRVIFADVGAARRFATAMNDVREAGSHPERAASAAEINAMGLLDELQHAAIRRFQEATEGRLFVEAHDRLVDRFGDDAVARMLEVFTDEFPPVNVYRGELTAREWLAGETGGTPHREIALEELVVLWVATTNPAVDRYRELFDTDRLDRETVFSDSIRELEGFFAGRPGPAEATAPGDAGPRGLLAYLRAPILASPHSLEGQLEFIRTVWGGLLGELLIRVLRSLDVLAEERKMFFGFGPGPVEVPAYDVGEDEPEAYSPDRDWMPRVVMLAKNVHVWLDQLSRTQGADIQTLDQIPDEELAKLARWGITGLWLIGLWQRSRASREIKQRMGDTEAVASAYSLYDYRIADDLGGEQAFDDLKARAWRHGIRMATDMVPNHMGIDSRWVVEHPDWFLSLPHSPFPAYTFSGPDLCDDDRVGVFIEDHYWTRDDAAVVFKRVDHHTGDARYVYHGNDGTSMPWNDTAQLDYRREDVREAVIQTILHVARRSPIIRFDAAMTLAKKHVHRLWFPEPGAGGDIASRSEHGMTREEFDRVMPKEFWREVVDRVAQEAPDTLLLAEAFWLLEGYFVRTLGMHRVYNSAFMNMLRDEKNAEYRQLIKSTLEFDPQILKRYVNFMSNPDERTAVDQFGRDDKYFGVATTMVTLPGLPMIGHGQVEGFAEKYGMEFKRPRWQEEPDPWLIERHERQLFPLVHRRWLFAEVDEFQLYDFFHADGGVDENVLAYSNRRGDQAGLVVYHNRFADTRGWIRTSAAALRPEPDGSRQMRQTDLADGLDLPTGDGRFVILRDRSHGLEYVRDLGRLRDEGLYLELGAYQLHTFLDLETVEDVDGRWRRLEEHLGGRGVSDLTVAMRELDSASVREPLRRLLAEHSRPLMKLRATPSATAAELEPLDEALAVFLTACRDHAGGAREDASDPAAVDDAVARAHRQVDAVLRLPALVAAAVPDGADTRLEMLLDDDPVRWGVVLAASAVRAVPGLVGGLADPRAVAMDWRLDTATAAGLGAPLAPGEKVPQLLRVVLACGGWLGRADRDRPEGLFQDEDVRAFVRVHTWQKETFFDGDAFAELLGWLLVVAAMDAVADGGARSLAVALDDAMGHVHGLEQRAADAGYRLDAFLATEEVAAAKDRATEPVLGTAVVPEPTSADEE